MRCWWTSVSKTMRGEQLAAVGVVENRQGRGHGRGADGGEWGRPTDAVGAAYDLGCAHAPTGALMPRTSEPMPETATRS